MAELLTIIFVIWCLKHPNPMSEREYKEHLKESENDFVELDD